MLSRATKCVMLRAADIACRYNGCQPVELLPVRRLPEAKRGPHLRVTADEFTNQTLVSLLDKQRVHVGGHDPVAVALGRPTTLDNEKVVDGVRIDRPQHVSGLLDRQTRPP